MNAASGRSANPRRIALQALRTWENGHRHCDDILSSLSRKHELKPGDHALLQQLFYGVIRGLSRLDCMVNFMRRGKLSHENRNLLRLGLYQLFDTRMPAHAAVHETVNLARDRRDRSVINGVLRNADRKREPLLEHIAGQSLAIRESHPDFLVERWTRAFGPDIAAELCAWNNQTPPVFLRINRLVEDAAGDIRKTIADHEQTTALEQHPDFFQIEGPVPKQWLQRGWIYLQDPSTSLSCQLLDAQPGESVLDACAAPGGKASLIAAVGARVTAVDRGESRLDRLSENLQRLRAQDSITVHDLDWLEGAPTDTLGDTTFDAILLDVPCSNTGVMRRRADVRWRINPNEFEAQAETQFAITEATLPFLKSGGRLVYSTCSIDAVENEQVIEKILVAHPDLTREASIDSVPWRDGFDGAYACRLRKA